MRADEFAAEMARNRIFRMLNDPTPTHQCGKCGVTKTCKVTYPDRYDDYCHHCGGEYIFVRIRRT